MGRVIVIEEDRLPELADRLAAMVLRSMNRQIKSESEKDPYMDSVQLEQVFPTMKASTIKYHIREGHYGKKMGGKGKLVARASELKKYHKL